MQTHTQGADNTAQGLSQGHKGYYRVQEVVGAQGSLWQILDLAGEPLGGADPDREGAWQLCYLINEVDRRRWVSLQAKLNEVALRSSCGVETSGVLEVAVQRVLAGSYYRLTDVKAEEGAQGPAVPAWEIVDAHGQGLVVCEGPDRERASALYQVIEHVDRRAAQRWLLERIEAPADTSCAILRPARVLEIRADDGAQAAHADE